MACEDEQAGMVSITRLRNGLLVRADLDDGRFCPDERAALEEVRALLTGAPDTEEPAPLDDRLGGSTWPVDVEKLQSLERALRRLDAGAPIAEVHRNAVAVMIRIGGRPEITMPTETARWLFMALGKVLRSRCGS